MKPNHDARAVESIPRQMIEAGADVSLDFEFPGDDRNAMVAAIFGNYVLDKRKC